MDGLNKESWTTMRDESGRSKRRVTSMLVTNFSDQMWGILRIRSAIMVRVKLGSGEIRTRVKLKGQGAIPAGLQLG